MSRAWLIGGGPGDADLLTLKAVRAIGAANVLLVEFRAGGHPA
ncbi:SAM-dependent methyltransferase, partial [Burkholderia sp.]